MLLDDKGNFIFPIEGSVFTVCNYTMFYGLVPHIPSLPNSAYIQNDRDKPRFQHPDAPRPLPLTTDGEPTEEVPIINAGELEPRILTLVHNEQNELLEIHFYFIDKTEINKSAEFSLVMPSETMEMKLFFDPNFDNREIKTSSGEFAVRLQMLSNIMTEVNKKGIAEITRGVNRQEIYSNPLEPIDFDRVSSMISDAHTALINGVVALGNKGIVLPPVAPPPDF